MFESDTKFRTTGKDLSWSAKIFTSSLLIALAFSLALYSFMLAVSEPAPVSEAITTTASAATAKVEITAEYIDPVWAIFIFNTLAIFSASAGTALFLLIHPLLIRDIELRTVNRAYSYFSIAFEKLLMPINRLLQRIVAFKDADFSALGRTDDEKEGTIWQYCGYGKDDYRMLAYMLPYTVPVMVLAVNGFLMGIMLAFFIFNGAMTGFRLFGAEGIIIGLFYNAAFFFISIVPHGIIEIPAILLAVSVGRRFAFVQSHELIDRGLFMGNTIESLKNDVSVVMVTVREYLNSRYLWKSFALMVMMLLLAAYIEACVTLTIVDRVMPVLDGLVEAMFL
ncbi:MAG: stage II sporulation protein M [Methanosarcinaceae archaeon]|nr:stage II sporulation protein M [Methanosarcinaceae archaeon]